MMMNETLKTTVVAVNLTINEKEPDRRNRECQIFAPHDKSDRKHQMDRRGSPTDQRKDMSGFVDSVQLTKLNSEAAEIDVNHAFHCIAFTCHGYILFQARQKQLNVQTINVDAMAEVPADQWDTSTEHASGQSRQPDSDN